MGSVGSPNAWTPYDTYKDCAQGICNIYCPQWCYYPPPDSGDDSGTTFSPLIIAVIGILASAFLLVSYYAIVTKYCRRRRQPRNPNVEVQGHRDEMTQDQWPTGLDEAHINSITVFKYNKGDRLVEGTECSVCLSEFQENENLRLLPKCCHAFHPSCIDVWLKSHTNCPLCRANATPTYALPPPAPAAQTSSAVNISALEIRQQDDLICVVEERERSHNEELFVINVADACPKSPLQSNIVVGNSETRNSTSTLGDQEGVRQFRRSISLGTFSCQRNLLVADILKIEEDDDEDLRIEICESDTGIGSSKGILTEESKLNNIRRNPELVRTPAAVKRSFSTGRFYFHKAS